MRTDVVGTNSHEVLFQEELPLVLRRAFAHSGHLETVSDVEDKHFPVLTILGGSDEAVRSA